MRAAVLIALLAVAAVAVAHETDNGDDLCLSPEIPDEFGDAMQGIIARFKGNVCPKIGRGILPACDHEFSQVIEIPLVWTVFYDPETNNGTISDETIMEQTDIMNYDYAGSGGQGYNTNWRFRTVSINRVANTRYYSNMIAMEGTFKEIYANDTATQLHMYTGNMNAGVLGMCYFSFMYPASSHMHGCLINHQAMVGGGAAPYDSGQTCTHEVGHHLGLYHVWQNKCGPRSDRVDDTPPQVTNSRGCPDPIPESCTPGLFDNIHNHMDYSEDDCRYLFTPGQSVRTDDVISTFHPGYLGASVRAAVLNAVPDAWDEARLFQEKMGSVFAANPLRGF